MALKLKRRVDYKGIPIAIEYNVGDVKGGNFGGRMMHCAYGYTNLRIDSADGEALDVYLNEGSSQATHVYVIDLHAHGKFEEQKAMVGFSSQADAEKMFDRHYDRAGARGQTRGYGVYEFHGYLQDTKAHDGRPLTELVKATQTLAANRRSVAKYKAKKSNKAKIKAHSAVKDAVESGKLKRPSTCSKCGSGGKLQFHHAQGYATSSRLKGRWLCGHCHQGLSEARARQSRSHKQ